MHYYGYSPSINSASNRSSVALANDISQSSAIDNHASTPKRGSADNSTIDMKSNAAASSHVTKSNKKDSHKDSHKKEPYKGGSNKKGSHNGDSHKKDSHKKGSHNGDSHNDHSHKSNNGDSHKSNNSDSHNVVRDNLSDEAYVHTEIEVPITTKGHYNTINIKFPNMEADNKYIPIIEINRNKQIDGDTHGTTSDGKESNSDNSKGPSSKNSTRKDSVSHSVLTRYSGKGTMVNKPCCRSDVSKSYKCRCKCGCKCNGSSNRADKSPSTNDLHIKNAKVQAITFSKNTDGHIYISDDAPCNAVNDNCCNHANRPEAIYICTCNQGSTNINNSNCGNTDYQSEYCNNCGGIVLCDGGYLTSVNGNLVLGTSPQYQPVPHSNGVQSVSIPSVPYEPMCRPYMGTVNPTMSMVNPHMSIVNPNMSIINPNMSIVNPNMSIVNPNSHVSRRHNHCQTSHSNIPAAVAPPPGMPYQQIHVHVSKINKTENRKKNSSTRESYKHSRRIEDHNMRPKSNCSQVFVQRTKPSSKPPKKLEDICINKIRCVQGMHMCTNKDICMMEN